MISSSVLSARVVIEQRVLDPVCFLTMESKLGDDFESFTMLLMVYCLINCVAIILDPVSMLNSTLQSFTQSVSK